MARTKAQEERFVKALESVALGLNALAKIEAKRFNREYPRERKPKDAEIFRRGEPEEGEVQTESGPIPGRFEKSWNTANGRR